MKTCSKCVMPETAETLAFDDKGVCSVCRQVEFKQTTIDWTARRAELDGLLDKARGSGDYDCIVPFSGGKDSTFTLWYLVRECGLKPLVVRFDHGFMRPTLIENNTRTFRTLGVDVHTFTPNWQVVRKLMGQVGHEVQLAGLAATAAREFLPASAMTLVLAGVPAALYERAKGLKESTPVSIGIWLAGTLMLVGLPYLLLPS